MLIKLKKLVKESELIISNQMDGALLPAVLKIFYKKKFILRTGFSQSFLIIKLRKNNFLPKYLFIFMSLYVYIYHQNILFQVNMNFPFKKRFPYFIKKTFVSQIGLIRKNLNLQKFFRNDNISLISVGRLEKQKNPFDLILISKLSNIPLTIIGDGFLKSYLLDYINDIKSTSKYYVRLKMMIYQKY